MNKLYPAFLLLTLLLASSFLGAQCPAVDITASDNEACPQSPFDIDLTGTPFPNGMDESGTFTVAMGSDPDNGALIDDGDGIATFTPEMAGPGTYIIQYEYSDGANCGGTVTTTITVLPQADVSISGPTELTVADGPTVFQGLLDASPASGVMFLSPSLPNGTFQGNVPNGTATIDPEPGDEGEYELRFTYLDENNCAVFAFLPITIGCPEVDLTIDGPTEVLVSDGPTTFQALLAGNPTGGVFSSIPVLPSENFDVNVFDGSVTITPELAIEGEYDLRFTYVDGNQCITFATLPITIACPEANITIDGPTELLPSDQPTTFQALLDGNPTGGVFSSIPVLPSENFDVNVFDGSVEINPVGVEEGQYDLRFTYVDGNQCITFATLPIAICTPPTMSGDEIEVCSKEDIDIVFAPTPADVDSFIIIKRATVVPAGATEFSTIGQGFTTPKNTDDPSSIADESFTLIGSTDNGVVEYEVTPWRDGCAGETVIFVVNVRPVDAEGCPPCAVTMEGGEVTVCNGEPIGFVFAPEPADVDFFVVTKRAVFTPDDATTFRTVGQGYNSTIETTDPNAIADESFTLLNTDQVGIVEYEVIPFRNGCQGEPVIFTVNVQPPGVGECPPCAPTLVGEEITICSRDMTGIVLEPDLSPADSFIIVKRAVFTPDDATEFRTIGQGYNSRSRTPDPNAIANESFTLKGTDENGIVSYEVTPWKDGCRGETVTYLVNVRPIPELITPIDQEICSGDATGIVFEAVAGSTSIDIFSISRSNLQFTSNSVSSPSGNATYQVLTSTTDPNAIADDITRTTSPDGMTGSMISYIDQLTVTPSFNGCPGDPGIYTLEVKPEPRLEDETVDICLGGPTTIVFTDRPTFVAADEYSISVSQTTGAASSTNATPDGTLTSNPNEIADDVWELADPMATDVIRYTVTPFADGCAGEPTIFIVELGDELRPDLVVEPMLMVTLDENGVATLSPDDFVISVMDNCDDDPEITFSRPLIFGCEDIGEEIIIQVTATDESGNTSDDSDTDEEDGIDDSDDPAVVTTTNVVVKFNEPDLGCISEINVTLDEYCQGFVSPQMLLTGNLICLEEFGFDIVVQDSDPSNGLIIDGCGRYQVTIDPGQLNTNPQWMQGFVGDFAPENWTFRTEGAGGDRIAEWFFNEDDELVLQTSSADAGCWENDLAVEATLRFPEAGQFAFRGVYLTDEFFTGFDVFVVSLEGDEKLVETSTNLFETEISVGAGERIIFRLSEVDGCASNLNEATITDISFRPAEVDLILESFLGCWGYVNAEDKTSPELATTVITPDTLLCDEVASININEAVPVNNRCYVADSEGDFVRYNNITNLTEFLTETELGKRLAAGGGLPEFHDGCSDLTICVTDILIYPGEDDCDGFYIERSFTATDGDCPNLSQEENEPTVFTYRINFYRPTLDDLIRPEYFPGEAYFSCADYDLSDGNPVPEPEDYPYFKEGIGGYDLTYVNAPICNLGVTYEDGPRLVTCENTYKFIRTFTVFDWCAPGQTRTYSQLVKVGDFSGPDLTLPTQDRDFDGVPDEGPLVFSTNSLDCSAFLVVPTPSVSDSCDANPAVTAVVIPFGDEDALPIGPFSAGSIAGPFPRTIGEQRHIMRFTAEDACGNKTTDEITFVVIDNTAPVAICEDGLNISLGSNGIAVIDATTIDKASYDECGEITLTIACVDENNNPLADEGDEGDDPDFPEMYYDPTLLVDCDDLGTKRISLRVEDASGNVNYCWLDVLIEDKGAPICIPPASDRIVCTDLVGDFPEDLNELFEADPEGTAALLDAQFGAANGVDNCGDVTITQTVEDKRNSCGKGQIIRDFVVEDPQGLTSSGTCRQVITVDLVHDYTIVLPGDEGSEDCVEDDYMGVTFDERGCDLITIFTKIDTFTATAEECYKLRITYEILNWCEYNGETDPYLIPRDADDDNDLEEDTYLHIEANDEDDLDDDTAELDRDNDPSNNFETGDKSFIAFLDIDDEPGLVQGTDVEEGYGTDGSRGAFLYRQFIKVYDENAPLLTVVEPDGPGLDNDGDCLGNIDLEFSVDDDCSPGSIGLSASLNAFVEDANDDGIITLAEFVPGSDVTDNITSLGNGTYEINLTDLPLGRHAVRISATDGCGNTAVKLIVFEIEDNKAPTPICINGLTATLMPDGEGGGMAAIWANDFIASPSTDCSGEVKFAIYRAVTASAAGFEPNVIDTGLQLNCEDLGILAVRIFAIDPNGQSDYCETTLFVQAFQETVCDNAGGGGSLAGTISTAAATPVANVEVNVTDGGNTMTVDELTNEDGAYLITDLDNGLDYTVQPRFNPDVNLGRVSTGDLILISRHILAIQDFASPFQLLAADVNQDGLINILDIIHIRRVILGLDDSFAQTPSWRFYTAAGAEVENINNLDGTVIGVDFTAVEMGNVSDAIENGYRTEAESRSRASLELLDQNFAAGEVFTVDINPGVLTGYQGTFSLSPALEIVDITAPNNANVGWNLTQAPVGLVAISSASTETITLTLRASTDGRLSQSLSLNDRITTTEGYTVEGRITGLSLNFSSSEEDLGEIFSVDQNTPNPFVDRTLISYQLPQAATVTLTVQDIQGRLILTRTLAGSAGYNQVELVAADLKGASGVLTYSVAADDQLATRKMVVVR